MKTSLIFFSTWQNSKCGLQRGFLILTVLVLLDWLWFASGYGFCLSTEKMFWSWHMFLQWLILCSALGVQNTASIISCLTYSSLVGLCVFGYYNVRTTITGCNEHLNYQILDTIRGVLSCALAAGASHYMLGSCYTKT